jgi:hypothetical protein
MFSKAKIALAAAVTLGVASAVLASERDTSVSSAQAERDWWESQHMIYQHPNGEASYGYALPDSEQRPLRRTR